jgi:hypothetical protein
VYKYYADATDGTCPPVWLVDRHGFRGAQRFPSTALGAVQAGLINGPAAQRAFHIGLGPLAGNGEGSVRPFPRATLPECARGVQECLLSTQQVYLVLCTIYLPHRGGCCSVSLLLLYYYYIINVGAGGKVSGSWGFGHPGLDASARFWDASLLVTTLAAQSCVTVLCVFNGLAGDRSSAALGLIGYSLKTVVFALSWASTGESCHS